MYVNTFGASLFVGVHAYEKLFFVSLTMSLSLLCLCLAFAVHLRLRLRLSIICLCNLFEYFVCICVCRMFGVRAFVVFALIMSQTFVSLVLFNALAICLSLSFDFPDYLNLSDFFCRLFVIIFVCNIFDCGLRLSGASLCIGMIFVLCSLVLSHFVFVI